MDEESCDIISLLLSPGIIKYIKINLFMQRSFYNGYKSKKEKRQNH